MKTNFHFNILFCLFLFISPFLFSQNNVALVPYRIGKQYALSDTLGKIIIKPQYDEIKSFGYYFNKKNRKLSDSRFAVKKNGKYFIVNYKNEIILKPDAKYDSIILDSEDCRIAYLFSNKKTGVFFENREIIPIQYDKISKEKNLSFIGTSEDKKILYNSRGKILLPLALYKYISYNGSENGKVSWYAKKNSDEKSSYFQDEIIEIDNKETSYYNNSTYQFPFEKEIPNIEERKKRIGTKYKTRIEYSFMKRYIELEKDGLHTFYDLYNEQELFPLQYEKFSLIGADHNTILFSSKKNGKYGLINLDGKTILPEEYDEITLKDNKVILKKNNLYGLYILNTVYKPIVAKYNKIIKQYISIPVSENWQFSVFKKGNDFIGENGIEYFKN